MNLEWNKTGVEQNRSGDFNPLENKSGAGVLTPLRMKETLRGLKFPLQISYLPNTD